MAGKDRRNMRTTETVMLERRTRIGELYRAGWPQHRIGQEFGISQPMVSKELAVLRAEWQASALQDFDAKKAEELAKIDNLERVAWESFEASREPVLPGRSAVKNRDGSEREIDPTTLPKRPGDPAWLRQVAWCIETRCKVFGFVKPPEQHNTVNDNRIQINWAEFTGEGSGGTDPVGERLELEARKVKTTDTKGGK